LRVTAFALLLLLPSAALAADIKATSMIDAVTVFPEGAEVTRLLKVQLSAGDQTVTLRDLPGSLVSDSVRIQGEAEAKVEIGSVDARAFFPSEDASNAAAEDARKKIEDAIQALNDKQIALQAAIEGANVQKQLVTNLINLPTRPLTVGSGTASEPDWGALTTLIGERLATANKTIAEAQIAQRDNAKKIADLQNQLNAQPGQGEQKTELQIHVNAAAPIEATLRVRYQVPGAAWFPVYDARLETGDGKEASKLTLVRRAIVNQSTGEAWDNVQLALSTTRPQAGTAAPLLVPLAVDFAPVGVAYDAAASVRRKLVKGMDSAEDDKLGELAPDAQLTAAAPAAAPAPEPVKPKMVANVEQRRATTVNTTFQALYVITDRQSIKSGVGDKRVQIDIRAIDPVLSVRAVPKFAETAYLYAKFKLDAETLLLPGTAALFRDGVFVGRGEVPQLSGGEEHEMGFGTDDKVRIKFASLGRKAGETGLISTSKTDTQSFKMTVKNLHARPIQVRILDQLPVSLNEDIKVDMLPGTASPSVRDVEDKKGLLAWDFAMEPDAQKELAFGYQVSWPNGKAVYYEQHEGPFALKTK
jgi:uncharacterized protein (TIGR02231 family)